MNIIERLYCSRLHHVMVLIELYEKDVKHMLSFLGVCVCVLCECLIDSSMGKKLGN